MLKFKGIFVTLLMLNLILISSLGYSQDADATGTNETDATIDRIEDATPEDATIAKPAYDSYILWDKYYQRLEAIQLNAVNAESYVNGLGRMYLGEEKDYYNNQEECEKVIKLGLQDQDKYIVYYTLLCAVDTRTKNLDDILINLLKSRSDFDYLTKKVLIWAIGKLCTEDIVLPLTQYMKSEEEPRQVMMLALALGRLGGDGDQTGPLIYLAQNHHMWYVKAAAILGLGRLRIKEDGCKDALKDNLKDPQKEIRFASLLSLAFIINKTDVDSYNLILKVLQKDPSDYVRVAASFALLKIYGYDEDFYAFLFSMMKDKNYRYPALDFIEDLAYRSSIETLGTFAQKLDSKEQIFKKLIYKAIKRIKFRLDPENYSPYYY